MEQQSTASMVSIRRMTPVRAGIIIRSRSLLVLLELGLMYLRKPTE